MQTKLLAAGLAALALVALPACSNNTPAATTTAPATTAPASTKASTAASAATSAASKAASAATSAASKATSAAAGSAAGGDVTGKAVKAANKAPATVGVYKLDAFPDGSGGDYKASGKPTVGAIYNKSFPYDKAAADLNGAQALGQLGTCGENKATPGEYQCVVKLDDNGIMRLGGYKGMKLDELVAFAKDYVKAAGTV